MTKRKERNHIKICIQQLDNDKRDEQRNIKKIITKKIQLFLSESLLRNKSSTVALDISTGIYIFQFQPPPQGKSNFSGHENDSLRNNPL